VGDLDVTTATSGSDLDPDGYTVTVDGGSSQAIGSNGTVTFTALAEGDYSVELTGIADNCTVSGANPRTVAVSFDATGSTTFTVTCAARVGDLDVTATTTGSDPDPDGYTATVDGTTSQTVGTNGVVTFTGLAEGDRSVELTGVAINCTVSGTNPRTITVPFGGTATMTFSVDCVPRVGDLDVTTTTTGQDLDPDGYTVTVDNGANQAIGISESVTFTALPDGDRTVELTGIADNCTVSGANPRTVTVPFGGTATTTFSIDCIPRVGNLHVTANTTGSDPDPDGYTVTVDGTTSQTVGTYGVVAFNDLAEGDHLVELTGVAGNCTVSGANSRSVPVPFGGTATTTFSIDCVPRVGNLDVTTATTGVQLDPDGYTITVDGAASQSIGIDGSVTITDLAEGDRSVALTDVAPNCTVSGSNPRTVTVPYGGTASTAFTVTCTSMVGDLEVTASTTGFDLDPDGYTVTVDGIQNQPLGINGTVTYTGLAEGDHLVELRGVAANCTVSGANPRTVTAPSGGTATTGYTVTCDPITTGDLEVTVTTTGSSLDWDGYTVTVDGTSSQAIGVNDTVRFPLLDPGPHSVQLSGVAINCTVVSPNPETVTVLLGQTASVAFSVSCGDQIFVGAGDISGCGNDRDEYTAQILDTIPGIVYTAGDNAYPDGRTRDYQDCYDPTWGRHKARTYAALGNREYNEPTGTADPSFDYFGELHVGPRGKGYYSFDLGAWHVIVLNDNRSAVPFDAGSEQDLWLQADLAANPNLCTMAIWHQPLFHSSSSSGSTVRSSRKILWDRLYAANADVVLGGHNHHYERFAPMDPDGNVDLTRGIRSFIVGTGGISSSTPDNVADNSEVRTKGFGVLKFTLRAGGYDWEFIPAIPAGTTFTDAGSGTCH
jgi:hypothetical protein